MPTFDEAAAVEAMARGMAERARQPLANIPSLEPVLVGSLGDAWPYLAQAALAALKPFLGGWRTMESAPRWPVWCLVHLPGWKRPAILSLMRVYGRTIQHPDNPTGDNQGRPVAEEWCDSSGDGDQDYRPTHWMPLPPSPDKGGE